MADASAFAKPLDALSDAEIAHWRGLIEQSGLNCSLGPDWTRISANSRAQTLQVQLGNALIFPFFVTTTKAYGLPLRVLKPAGNLVSYDHGLIAGPTGTDALEAVLFGAVPAWDLLQFSNLDIASNDYAALNTLTARRDLICVEYQAERSPLIRIESDFDSYLATRSKQFRYNLQRKLKKTQAAAGLTLAWFDQPGQPTAQLVAAIQRIEPGSWKKQAGLAIQPGSQESRYYSALIPWLSQSGQLLACVANLNGEPVAYTLCYRCANKVGLLKTSYLDSSKALSPGWTTNHAVIQRAFELGVGEFDFHGDDQPYKRDWANDLRDHRHLAIYANSWRGKLIGRLRRRFGQHLQGR